LDQPVLNLRAGGEWYDWRVTRFFDFCFPKNARIREYLRAPSEFFMTASANRPIRAIFALCAPAHLLESVAQRAESKRTTRVP